VAVFDVKTEGSHSGRKVLSEMQPAPRRIPPSPERSATQGYFHLPNSLAENQGLMTPVELAFVLIVCRRGENTVSDRNWEDWTGKDARSKRNAIRGLKEKGLHVSGHGDRAKFYFERDRWDSYVKSKPRHMRARTIGRKKSVRTEPGMQVHQECRERGCQRLCTPETLIPFPATEVWKPVSKTEVDPPPKVEPSPPPFEVPAPTAIETETPTAALAKSPHTQSAALFQTIIGTFLSLGVAISESDILRCGKIWSRLKIEEKRLATAYASARAAAEWSECDTRYVPRPWNYLQEQHWQRRQAVQPKSRADKAGDIFDALWKKKN
jgi:hypothetical protein